MMRASIQLRRGLSLITSNLLHVHLTVLWAERCPYQVEPSTRGVSRIAAGGTDALDPTGLWPFAAAGMAAGANAGLQSAVGQWPCFF